MRTAVVVQARINSSRLAKKIFNKVGGWPLLRHVLSRCREVASAHDVVCAVPDTDDRSFFSGICDAEGVKIVAGSERDVLSRYLIAAESGPYDVILRVTSDCPLIDPNLCNKVLERVLRGGVDYACNNMPPSFPHGLDCEAFTRAALERAGALATDPYDREHVTPYMRRDRNMRRDNIVSDRPEWKNLRLTLDYPEDLQLFHAIEERCPLRSIVDFDTLAAFFHDNPSLAAINAIRRVIR